jgi:hypothetical protein
MDNEAVIQLCEQKQASFNSSNFSSFLHIEAQEVVSYIKLLSSLLSFLSRKVGVCLCECVSGCQSLGRFHEICYERYAI